MLVPTRFELLTTLLAAFLLSLFVAAGLQVPDAGGLLAPITRLVDLTVEIGALLGPLLTRSSEVLALGVAVVCLLAVLLPRRLARSTAGERCRPLAALALLAIALGLFVAGRVLPGVVAGLLLGLVLAIGRQVPYRLHRPAFASTVLFAILVAGAAVRLVALAEHPPGFGTHATGHLQMSLELYDAVLSLGDGDLEPLCRLLGPEGGKYIGEQHGPMAIVNGLGFMVFGAGFYQARLAQAALGTLSLALAFLFGRRLVDARYGLMLAFLLAFAPWHIAISRFNDAEHVLSPLQALLALWLVLRAIQRRRILDGLLAGVACALSFYVYATNQALLAAIVLFVVAMAAFEWRTLRRGWRHVIPPVAAFLVASWPHLKASFHAGRYFPIRSSYHFTGSDAYAITSLDERLPANLAAALRQLFQMADDQWFTMAGGGLGVLGAVLCPAAVVLCLCGLWRRSQRGRSLLLLLWVSTALLPAVLLAHVEFRRLLLAALAGSALMALVVCGIDAGVRRLEGGRGIATLLLCLAAVGYASVNVAAFFERTLLPESRSTTTLVAMAEVVREHLGDGPVVVVLPPAKNLPEHINAIRLEAFTKARRLEREEGRPLSEVVRVVPIERLEEEVASLSHAEGDLLLVAPYGLYLEQGSRRILSAVIARRSPGLRPFFLQDSLEKTVIVAWRVPRPASRP
jgi:hypothetical protein